MKISLKGSSHYQVKNGKLVPKLKPKQQTTNYRFIPYSPINKPCQQDYFRATIDELIQQNTQLKQQLQLMQSSGNNYPTNNQQKIMITQNVVRLENQLKVAKQKYIQCENQLQRNKKLSLSKDIQIQQLKEQNQNLNYKVYGLAQEMKGLKLKLVRSQIQSQKINKVIESFSGTIEKVSQLESALSENPELSDRNSVKSIQRNNNMYYDNFMYEEHDDRFMTPKQKVHDLKPNKNRSAEQRQKPSRLFSEGIIVTKAKQTAETDKHCGSEFNGSGSQSQGQDNPKNLSQNLWGNNNHINEYHDPVTGTFSPLFTRQKK